MLHFICMKPLKDSCLPRGSSTGKAQIFRSLVNSGAVGRVLLHALQILLYTGSKCTKAWRGCMGAWSSPGEGQKAPAERKAERWCVSSSQVDAVFPPELPIPLEHRRMARLGKDLKDHGVPIPLPWAGTPPTSPGCCKPQGRARSPCKASRQQRIPLGPGTPPAPEELCRRPGARAQPALCQLRESPATSSTGKALPTPQCRCKGNGSCESRLGFPIPVTQG